MQEILPLKVKQKMRQGDLFQTSFCLFYKASNKGKASGHYLSLNLFW